MKGYKLVGRSVMAVLFAMASVLMPATAMAQDIFAELAAMDQVESTYVSGRFAHNKKYWSSNSGLHRMNLSKGFSSLYSYQCYSEETVKKAKEILKRYLKKNPDVEVMMKTKHGVQEYVVYEKFIDDGKKVSQMIIWNSDTPCVCELVVINWDKGMEREVSVRFPGNDVSGLLPDGLIESLEGLERLKDLECLENLDLSGLSSLDVNVF